MILDDYFSLSNRISHLEKIVEELMERLSGQEYRGPAYEGWDEQEICNAHSQCGQINESHHNLILTKEGME